MCIRDRDGEYGGFVPAGVAMSVDLFHRRSGPRFAPLSPGCLLYTSDAADERSSVDLGGRRIIKKKKTYTMRGPRAPTEHK